MTAIKDGWFYEKSSTFPGQAFGLEVEKIIFEGKSKYQDILVFQSKTYGMVLALDGIIQCSSRDEFSYQEMITHLPLNSHPDPKKVLIIGGGDGGVAREVVKHPQVKTIDLCEIDEMVIDVSKKFIPEMASGFNSEKLSIHIADGFKFLEEHTTEYDVIIADISDPEGPAERLFGESFYILMKKALKDSGLLCVQGESFWIDLPLIKEILAFSERHFPVVSYAHTLVPTYTTGVIGFVLCSNNKANEVFVGGNPLLYNDCRHVARGKETNFKNPVRTFSEEERSKMNLKYYKEDVHKASFVFPSYVSKELGL